MPRLLRSTFLAFLLSAIGLSLSFSPVYAQDKLKKCAEPYGTLAVVEPQDEVLRMLSKYALSSPTSLIRIMV